MGKKGLGCVINCNFACKLAEGDERYMLSLEASSVCIIHRIPPFNSKNQYMNFENLIQIVRPVLQRVPVMFVDTNDVIGCGRVK